MSRFKTEDEPLDHDKDVYVKLIHLLSKYGYLHISDKNGVLELQQLRNFAPIIEGLHKKYKVT
jgi:hypothetical protein